MTYFGYGFSFCCVALGLDEDIPDYDMDSEDEEWVAGQSKSQPLTNSQFEGMMDRLEKGSGNQVC